MESVVSYNFYQYLPGGLFREHSNPLKKKIIKDLDKILQENNFDSNSCLQSINLGNSMIINAFNLFNNGEEEKAKLLGNEGEQIRLQAQEKLYGIFQKMLKLGYSFDTLTA